MLIVSADFNNLQYAYKAVVWEQDPYTSYGVPLPVTCTTDFLVYTKDAYPVPTRLVPFSSIRLPYSSPDFPIALMERFDSTCTQFAIENAKQPTNVRGLNHSAFDLLNRSRFMLSIESPVVLNRLCHRINKYERRGYMFAGFQLSDDLALRTEDGGLFSVINIGNNKSPMKENEVIAEVTEELPDVMLPFEINKSRVLEALSWLRNHHDLYMSMDICDCEFNRKTKAFQEEPTNDITVENSRLLSYTSKYVSK